MYAFIQIPATGRCFSLITPAPYWFICAEIETHRISGSGNP
ncbi:hypothetical protein EC2729250_1844 [Escherichia coli 2729250]|nr:hypothetical protein EC2729250_1844 [Escherichia coli 2729250]